MVRMDIIQPVSSSFGDMDKWVAASLLFLACMTMAAVFSDSPTSFFYENADPLDWTAEDIYQCQAGRTNRVRRDCWGDPDTYRRADEIRPGLWLGNICAAVDNAFLRENKIGLVLSMAAEWPINSSRTEIIYDHVDLYDSGSEDTSLVLLLLESIFRTIDDHTSSGVLVYCNIGVSRSTTAMIYTLVQMDKKDGTLKSTYAEYLAHVQARRPVARPNSQYRAILTQYISDAQALKSEL